MQSSHILGMNARSQHYVSLNSHESRRYGFSKLRTKSFVVKHGIGVAELYASLKSFEELRAFDWSIIVGGFALKPSNGLAGRGVVVLRRRKKGKQEWEDVDGRVWTVEDLELHASDILSGLYSTWGSHTRVIIEERVPIHPDLVSLYPTGTPDIRIILYNKIPIMGMIRIPTEQSGGRANLDLGAIALGVDLSTGKTTFGVMGKSTMFDVFPADHPLAGLSTQGIAIPMWTQILRTSIRTANATGHKFFGIDVFVHPERGPLVAEVNNQPGLSIQLANRRGLRRRLERVHGIEPKSVTHAVKISQALFADTLSLGEQELELPVFDLREPVVVYGDNEIEIEGVALLHTGRDWSAIGRDTAYALGLLNPDDVLWEQGTKEEGRLPVVEVSFKLHDRVRKAQMIVSKKMSKGKYLVQLGRKDLEGSLIRVGEDT